MMKSVVCTLYEGNYHYGVAALVNSLHKFGFEGDFYIGYRGQPSPWAKSIESTESLNWQGGTTYIPTQGLNLHFLPITVNYHLSNYKPAFMLKLFSGPAKDASGLFYFDPDIVNKCDWAFYEKWITFGVAVVHETIWNDMPSNHPKRQQWATVAKAGNLTILNNLKSYFNSGFVGVSKHQINFLTTWDYLINVAVDSFNYNKNSFFQSEYDSDLF